MDLSCEPYAVPRCDLDEDGFPMLPEPEPQISDMEECAICGAHSFLAPASWDRELLVCAGCDPEPDCTCERMDVDVYDASGCELHGRKVA